MKKLLIIFAVSILGMVACNERVEVVNDNANLDGIKSSSYYTRADLQNLSLDSCREIFNTITPQNRYDLYLDKLTFVLGLNISIDQENLINDILSNLSVNVFDWNSNDHINFTTNYLETKRSDLENYFSNQQGLNAFYHLYDISDLNDIPSAPIGGNGFPNCDCDLRSYFGACQVLGNYCDEMTCNNYFRGCGFLSIWRCNGMCDDVPQPSGSNNPYSAQLFSIQNTSE